MSKYYDLKKIRWSMHALGQEPIRDINSRIDNVVAETLRSALVNTAGPSVPSPIDDPAGYVELLEQALTRGRPAGPPVYLDDLLSTEAFRGRDELKLRIAVAVRKHREDEHLARQGDERFDARNSRALLFYALMKEAKASRRLNWKYAEETIDRALSLQVAPDTEVASEIVAICSPDLSVCGELLDLALEKLEALTARSGQHWMYGNCHIPRTLSTAADIVMGIHGDWRLAASLELRAASFEEERHGRAFPSVGKHLYNAGRLLGNAEQGRVPSRDAMGALRESLEIIGTCCGSDSPRWAHHAEGLAVALIASKDREGAAALLTQAKRIFESEYGLSHSRTTECSRLLGQAIRAEEQDRR
jgi:hypothetical protein